MLYMGIMRVRDMRMNSCQSMGRVVVRVHGVNGVNGLCTNLSVLQRNFSLHIFCAFKVALGHDEIEGLIHLLGFNSIIDRIPEARKVLPGSMKGNS